MPKYVDGPIWATVGRRGINLYTGGRCGRGYTVRVLRKPSLGVSVAHVK
jgi:hypothetical protein